MDNDSRFASADKIILCVIGVILLITIAGFVAYLRTNPVDQKLESKIAAQQTQIDRLTMENNRLQRQNSEQVFNTMRPYATPLSSNLFLTHQFSSSGPLQITGIYELFNTVIYTTNVPVSTTIYSWETLNAKSAIPMIYGSRVNTGDSFVFRPGMSYQIKLLSGNQSILSEVYSFTGNRTVVTDPRCRIIKDTLFLQEYCPLTTLSDIY
jgi:hypothetical protein